MKHFSVSVLQIYLSTQVQFRNARLPVPLLCLALLSGAVLWGFSRAASYRHHWTDIFAGFALGTSFALYLVNELFLFFKEEMESAIWLGDLV